MADGRYILGLDAGNTVIKAVLFDLQGLSVAAQARDLRSNTPSPGHVERDLGELWSSTRQVIIGCIEEAGVSPSEIIGIGCAGHGNGLYLLDRAGAPLVGIQSLDTRAAGLAAELSTNVGTALYDLCLQKPWPAQTPVLLAWIKRHQPELYQAAGSVLLCKDFITHNLTGELVSDRSDMSGCGLTVMPDCTYKDDLLQLYGIADAREKLPLLIDPLDRAGAVTARAAAETGLPEGTPVIGGYFDVVSSAMGSGVVRPGEGSIVAGTWSINQVFSTAPARDENLFMVSGFGPGRFVNIEASATSAGNLEWYVREFVERGSGHDDPFGFCNTLVSSIEPAPDDPFFHPFLFGSGQGSHFRGGFYGLTGWHSEGHLLRALFEGVAFEHRRHIEVLKSSGMAFDRAVLSGGGSRSEVWPRMFADILGVPISVAEARETGALGAAIGVAVATGVYATYEEGVEGMTRRQSEFIPDPLAKRRYDMRYERYLGLIDALRGFWDSMPPSAEDAV